MSKLTERLREIKIYNPYNFTEAGSGKVYVVYHPIVQGRAGIASRDGYHVVGIRFSVDPLGHWTVNGDKIFNKYSYASNHDARDAALEWAAKKFGIEKWHKMPWRESWCDAKVYEAVMKLLKESGK